MNMFMDSYLKRLKRPELFNYNADQSFGANMVHGSEMQNPWANRNQDNAKYGSLGGTQPGTISQGPENNQQIPGVNAINIPGYPKQSAAQSTFANLLGATAAPVLSKGITDLLSPAAKTAEDVVSKMSDMGGGYGKLAGEMLDVPTTGDAMEGIGSELTRDSSKSLSDAVSGVDTSSPLGFDPTSAATAAAPMLAKMFGLKGTAGDAVDAAAGVGGAALQGGVNPIADVGALISLVKLFGGLF